MRETDGAVAELWLETLQEIAGRAAHEIKGTLNGLSVNLEVVRSRSARPGTDAGAVASFAEAAGKELDTLITRTEALLALTREPHAPLDVGLLTERLGALLVPAVRTARGTLELAEPPAEAVVGAAPHAARLAVGAALAAAASAAAEEGGRVTCRVEREREGDGIAMRVRREAGAALTIRPEVARAVAVSGIRVEHATNELTLVFPRPHGASADGTDRRST